MATYYIDQLNGNDALDGLSPETARCSYTDIDVQAGDTVLFKRGSFYRDKLHAKAYVRYGAYGEGEMPTFCGSFDVSLPEDWEETDCENVWKCTKPIIGDVGNIVYNEADCTATFRWEKEELCAQGDFYDERNYLGDRFKPALDEKTLYVYSVGNPATVYSHIEAIGYHTRQLVNLCHGLTIEDLHFKNSGVHALAGSGDHITVRNCLIENIGGCAWSKKLKIRFGNACALEHRHGGAVAFRADNIVAGREIFKHIGVGIDDGDIAALGCKLTDQGGTDFSAACNDNIHICLRRRDYLSIIFYIIAISCPKDNTILDKL